MFAYLVTQDTYAAASKVHDLLVKTHPADRDKIAEIKALVAGTSTSMGCYGGSTSGGRRPWPWSVSGLSSQEPMPGSGCVRPPSSRGFAGAWAERGRMS